MAHAALAPLIGAEFDKFLYAPIREDRNGTPLSVLSALARLDVDPWQEALSLALMPKATAAVRLAALIAALPDEQTKDIPAKSIAADLVALLPKTAGFSVRFAGQRVCGGRAAAGADPFCFGRSGHHGYDRPCALRQSFVAARKRRQAVGRAGRRRRDHLAARARSLGSRRDHGAALASPKRSRAAKRKRAAGSSQARRERSDRLKS